MKRINRYRASEGFSCEDCGDYVIRNATFFVLVNRADESVKVCPVCAAHRMAETLDATNRTEYYNNEEE